MIHTVVAFILAVIASSVAASAQVRVAVLPFRNMDGKIALNEWSVALRDSIVTSLTASDPESKTFVVIPTDSLEMAISDLNLDPTNPQYESDVWKAVIGMGATYVVQGNFLTEGERVLLNAYVYTAASRMPNSTHQAKNIVKSPTTYLTAVPLIVKRLLPALK
jgi:TolB-like protein